ncbi:MAG: hypothetical protein QOJ04_625 [Caballeronia sp.]|jgi:hypothetical protein|nr:hypothetical protein [Caballeronia sp.]
MPQRGDFSAAFAAPGTVRVPISCLAAGFAAFAPELTILYQSYQDLLMLKTRPPARRKKLASRFRAGGEFFIWRSARKNEPSFNRLLRRT